MYQQLNCEGSTVVISVQKSSVVNGCYLIRFDEGTAIFDIIVTKTQMQKLYNVLRNVCYPRCNEERVKVCLNATVTKSSVESLQFGESTSVATMATFLKSLRVEDVAFGGTVGCSENCLPLPTNTAEQ